MEVSREEGKDKEREGRGTDKRGRLNLSVKVLKLSPSLYCLQLHVRVVLLLVKLKEELLGGNRINFI